MGVESEIETIQSSSDEDEEISYPKVLGILFFWFFLSAGSEYYSTCTCSILRYQSMWYQTGWFVRLEMTHRSLAVLLGQ